jgi:glycosyltransferase involved in cell wall biosynthesis
MPSMDIPASPGIMVDNYPAVHRSLRIAVVTETYPPEVNGVAMTIAKVVEGLHHRNHDVQLIRPRQDNQVSRQGSNAACSLALKPDGVVASRRHSPSYDSSSRLASGLDGGAINQHLNLDATPESGDRSVRFHEVLMRGLPIPRYPNLRMGVPSKKALVQLWSVHRPDVVHIATEGPLGWSALQAAHHLKLPISSDFRTNFHAYSQHYGIGWLRKPIMAYLRKFHNRTLCTMVPTEALKRDLEACGLRHLMVVARGVDTRQFNPARRSEALRASWGVGAQDLVLACVGRLAPEKNLDTVAAAFDAVLAHEPRARLLLVGDGPMRATLQARYPNAIFAGQRSGDDLAAHYASADLFLFASVTETFGNVTTEAMASGLPVVAYNYAAAAQLIQPGENGVLVPFSEQASFIQAALALALNPTQRLSMGAAARHTASQWDWDRIVARFEGVLQTVIRQADSQPGVPFPAEVQPRT